MNKLLKSQATKQALVRNGKKLHLERSYRNGLGFDGVNNVILVENAASLNITNAGSAFAFALKANNTLIVQNIVSKGLHGERQYNITLFANTLIFRYGNGFSPNDYDISIPFTNTSQINHIIWNKVDNNAYNAQIYVNGRLVNHTVNASSLAFINANPYRVQIGDFPDGYYSGVAPFNGILYDMKLFNTALTPSECAQLYRNQGEFIPMNLIPNCVLDMRLDQKQGFNAPDLSLFANHGTLTNYTMGDVSLGVGNKWIDDQRNSILI